MSIFNVSKSLLDSITTVIKDGRTQYSEQQAEMDKKAAAKLINEAKTHTVPKTDKEKKLAALAEPKDKITHADVMVGRGVGKMKESMDAPEKPFKYNKKTGTFDRVKKMDEMSSKEKMKKGLYNKEEVEQIDEISKSTLGSYVRKAAKQAVGAANAAGREEMSTGKNSSDNRSLANRRMGGILRATRKMEEATDTPGNGREHQCAIHVKSEQFGEGKTLFSQHAEPDADGNIGWYDVMFEHGIEKHVSTAELEILVSESHMNHKKKKGM